jgi:hypothetical protein
MRISMRVFCSGSPADVSGRVACASPGSSFWWRCVREARSRLFTSRRLTAEGHVFSLGKYECTWSTSTKKSCGQMDTRWGYRQAQGDRGSGTSTGKGEADGGVSFECEGPYQAAKVTR